MKVAICDDVRTVCSQLERYILEFQAQKATKIAIEVFYTGEELIDCLRKGGSFDLIFLDIELDHINGVEVGHIIRKERKDYITKIVYISGKDHYYRELLEVQTFHFLSKPLEKKKVFEDLSVVAELLGTGNHMFSFMIKRQNHSIPINEILYFESKRRQVKVVSTKGTFVYYANLQQVSHAVAAFRFIQPHTY